jgi:glucokinase
MIDKKEVYNRNYLKLRKQSMAIRILREKGPMYRAQLSKELGVVKSTASSVVKELIDLNIIFEGKKIIGNVGKNPTLLHFNEDYYYFLIVIMTPEKIFLSICNLNGKSVRRHEILFPEYDSATDILNLTFSNIDEILSDIDINKIRFIVVGSPETFELKTKVINWAPYVKDWIGKNLESIFNERYKVPVLVEHHVKLETLGEHWKSYSGVANMVYLLITTGIAAGIIIDGKIRYGNNGYLGQVAFLPIPCETKYNKFENSYNNTGNFESHCDIKYLRALADNYLKENNSDIKLNNFNDIVNLYENNKKIKDMINNDFIKNLSIGIATIIVMFDPEFIVINGEIVDFGSNFLNKLNNEIDQIFPSKCRICYSTLKDKAGMFGAIRYGLNYIKNNINNNLDFFYNI